MRETGTVIGGRYEVLRTLGAGGMGEVLLAHDRMLDRDVAVKVLASHVSDAPEYVSRFRREVQAAAALHHPNVVVVFDGGEENGRPFLVMEYVEGESLADRLSKVPCLRPAEAAAIARGVCRALDAAHAKGFVHRDVKPANILLRSDAEGEAAVKVVDFGIVRVASTATTATATMTVGIVGTPGYMSPEHAQGGLVDARSDIYALGCVLYQMLTGKCPFGGDSAVAVATAHVLRPVPDPREIVPGIPAGIAAVTMKAMAKSPDARFATARAMHDALAGDQTAPLPAPVRRRRPRRRWRGVLAGVAVIVVVAAAGFALSVTAGPRIRVGTPASTTRTTTTTGASFDAAGFDTASNRLDAVVTRGSSDGSIGTYTSSKLGPALAALRAAGHAGRFGDARTLIDDMRSRVDKARGDGINTTEIADALKAAIDNLAGTLPDKSR